MESTEVFARRLASPVNCLARVLLLDGALRTTPAAYHHSVQGKGDAAAHGDFELALALRPTRCACDLARRIPSRPGTAGRLAIWRLLPACKERSRGTQGPRQSALVSVQGSWKATGSGMAIGSPLHQPEQAAAPGQPMGVGMCMARALQAILTRAVVSALTRPMVIMPPCQTAGNPTSPCPPSSNGRALLLVEEETSDGLLLNNPAGHLTPANREQYLRPRSAGRNRARFCCPRRWWVYLNRFVKTRTGDDLTYLRFCLCRHAGYAPQLAYAGHRHLAHRVDDAR